MAINPKLLSVVTIIFVTTVYATCHKKILGCSESSYTFQLDAKVWPDRDTISVNDTVWVEINLGDNFIDIRSNKSVDFSNANNLGIDMGFVKLISNSPVQFVGTVSTLNYILLNGTELTSANPQLLKEFLIKDINGRYIFKLGVIPKSSGIYSFNLSNSIGVYRIGNPCPKADFNTRLIQTNQHYYLHPNGAGVTPTGADYYFYVK